MFSLKETARFRLMLKGTASSKFEESPLDGDLRGSAVVDDIIRPTAAALLRIGDKLRIRGLSSMTWMDTADEQLFERGFPPSSSADSSSSSSSDEEGTTSRPGSLRSELLSLHMISSELQVRSSNTSSAAAVDGGSSSCDSLDCSPVSAIFQISTELVQG